MAVDPDGYPSHVASGELIESAWGNATVDVLQSLRYWRSINGLAGEGHLSIQGAFGTFNTDATGQATINFPQAFAAQPVALVSSQSASESYTLYITGLTALGMFVAARRLGDGSVVVNGQVSVSWLAVGLRS